MEHGPAASVPVATGRSYARGLVPATALLRDAAQAVVGHEAISVLDGLQ